MPAEKRLRMTKQRRVILSELKKLKTHPSADELHQRVRRVLPRISLGTVYRNLEVLSREGSIEKLEVGGSQRRYDANTTAHYHVRCVKCGRVEDVSVQPVKSIERRVRAATDYEVLGHSLEFVGLCPRCKASRMKDQSGL